MVHGFLEHLRHIRFATTLVVVLDSLRWDTFNTARTPVIDGVATYVEQRWSYASWTLPSHACLFTGLLPFTPRPELPSAVTYRRDYQFWSKAFAAEKTAAELDIDAGLAGLAVAHGWAAHARVAMPVLRPQGRLSHGFADYQLSPRRIGLAAQVASVELDRQCPNLLFINAGETHYPYLRTDLPYLPGAHGAARGRTAHPDWRYVDGETLRAAQVRATEVADARLGEALQQLPKPTLVVVMSDHGEMFGEDGMFGHGPLHHRLLFEVPLAIGIAD